MKSMRHFSPRIILLALLLALASCSDHSDHKLTILAGRGLKKPMEDIRTTFSKKHGIDLHIVYGGSGTLLATMKRSNKGDVFIPGSLYTMEKAGDMIVRHEPVALHTPVIAVTSDNPQQVASLADLATPGLKVGIAHKQMAALGRTSEELFAGAGLEKEIMANVIIKAQTVEVLLDHLVNKELDAAILWADMLHWPEATGVTGVVIDPQINLTKKIHAALLRQSNYPEEAGLFVDFIATEGVSIFKQHGFEATP